MRISSPTLFVQKGEIMELRYSTRYYTLGSFCDIKEEWETLQKGPEMTYFQTYDWYKSLLSCASSDTNKYESRFVALFKDSIVKVIAPIFVIKHSFNFINKRGIYLLGYGGWSDYLNFIYNDASEEDLIFIFNDIKSHYGCSKFFFEDVPQQSLLYSAIIDHYAIEVDEKTICVELSVPKSLEAYHKCLSKNTRQNLRTATNRLIKSGLDIKCCFDDNKTERIEFEELREKGLHRKYRSYSIIERLKIHVAVILRHSFRSAPPFYTDANSRIMTAYINNELAAFFNYGFDKVHKCIVMMAVGTSGKYWRYSPGMLLVYEYVKHAIEKREIEVIDFTRGNERYKYALGGKEHYNHRVVFLVH